MLFQKFHEVPTRNGRMQLVRLFGSERLLAEDRTEQSGSYMNSVWKVAFKAIPRKYKPETITFFGVGLGGALAQTAKKFPDTSLTGIEWDHTLFLLGQKKLKEYPNIILKEADAETWIHTMPKTDISCVDLFTGSDVAPCVRKEGFLEKIIENSQITFINIYTHTEILDNVDNNIAPLPHKRLQYYASTIGMYGSPHLRS